MGTLERMGFLLLQRSQNLQVPMAAWLGEAAPSNRLIRRQVTEQMKEVGGSLLQ